MSLAEIKASGAVWPSLPAPDTLPVPGKSYNIFINAEFEISLSLEIWVVFFSENSTTDDNTYLCRGTVMEIYPLGKPVDLDDQVGQEIVFQLNEIVTDEDMLVDQVLDTFPEREYPQELDNSINADYGGCGYFGNKLSVSKFSQDSYYLDINYYGCINELFITVDEGKMYIWKTRAGYERHDYLFTYSYGKYLVPKWLQQILDNPLSDKNVRYYDATI